MATSVTELILDNLKTTIEGVTTANGYNTDIKQVKRLADALRNSFTSYPAARIWINNISKTDGEDAGWQICSANIVIEVYIKNTVDPETDLIHAMDDIEEALAVGITRGGNAWTTRATGQDFFVMQDRHEINGVGELEIQIDYEHRRADPYDG